MTTSKAFIGFVPNTTDGMNFLSDLRKLFKGSGLRVLRYSRNPNRKQFYNKEPYGYRFGKHCYCQNLPLKYATHYGLYVREVNGRTVRDELNSVKARTIYDTVRKIYEDNKVDLGVVSNLSRTGNFLPKK